MSGRNYIAEEPDRACELCGKWDECRPYGPKGEQVCFDCALKDSEAMKRGMDKHIFGEGHV